VHGQQHIKFIINLNRPVISIFDPASSSFSFHQNKYFPFGRKVLLLAPPSSTTVAQLRRKLHRCRFFSCLGHANCSSRNLSTVTQKADQFSSAIFATTPFIIKFCSVWQINHCTDMPCFCKCRQKNSDAKVRSQIFLSNLLFECYFPSAQWFSKGMLR